MYCFRRRLLWGSKLHAGYSIALRFISNGALFEDDVKTLMSKNRVQAYYNGYVTGRAAS